MALTDLIPVPPNINPNLNAARQITMKSLLGLPQEPLRETAGH